MRFLLKTFGIACCFFLALLYWWRPAPELLSVKQVNWAAEYEKAYTPAKHLWSVMDEGLEMIRASESYLPLPQFIHKKTKDRLSQVESAEWQAWIHQRFSGNDPGEQAAVFMSNLNPLSVDLPEPWGYLEVMGKERIHLLSYDRLDASELGGKSIPATLRFPYRTSAGVLFCTTVLLASVSGFLASSDHRISSSSAGKGCRVFTTILVGGAALTILPFLYRWYNDSPPFIAMGGFVIICGFIGVAMFGHQVVMVSRMLKGEGVLSHWVYTADEWGRYTDWAYTDEKKEKRGLLLLVSVIIVIVGGGFCLLMMDEAAVLVFLFLLGLILFLWSLVLILPWLTHRRNLRGIGEVYVGPYGIYLNGSVHSWKLLGARLENARYIETPFPLLSVTYSYLVAAGRALFIYRQYAEVNIPVPEGKASEAKKIAAIYMKGLHKDTDDAKRQ